MAYTIPEIIVWAEICQPLARIGGAKKNAKNNGSIDHDLDIKLYDTRKDLEAQYDADPDSAETYTMGNYLLALCGVYLFTAQATIVGGGTITPIIPNPIPDPYDFYVDSSSFIVTGASIKVFPVSWAGLNILFVRSFVTQSKVNDGITTCYSWNKSTRLFTLINGVAQVGENFQIYPVL